MDGARDLGELLRTIRPEVRPGEWVFVEGAQVPEVVRVDASVHEPEGLQVVVSREDAEVHGLRYDFVAAWIVLRVHSAIAAIGLTAAVATALTHAQISCNVIAGLRHDHLLVPADRASDSLAALQSLAELHALPSSS